MGSSQESDGEGEENEGVSHCEEPLSRPDSATLLLDRLTMGLLRAVILGMGIDGNVVYHCIGLILAIPINFDFTLATVIAIAD